MRTFANRHEALLVTAFVFVVAFVLHAGNDVLTGDEGIILEPARRILRGERPYVDFFAYMSPGSYWIHAASLRVFGENLPAARLPVLTGFAVQCGILFWLVRRWTSRQTAGVTVALYLLLQFVNPEMLTPQHRWDSGSLALAAVALLIGGGPAWAAGALTAFSVLCTPSMIWWAAVALLWCLWTDRRRALVFAASGLACAIPVAIYLAATGQLFPLIEQLGWLARNYHEVNHMHYGSIVGGWAALLTGSTASELPVRLMVVLALAVPAILPPLALGLWAAKRRTIDPAIVLLLGATAAFVAGNYPRMDVMHLAFTMAAPLALVAIAFALHVPARLAGILTTITAASTLIFLIPLAQRLAQGPDPQLTRLRQAVPRGSTLYVHPYLPVLYFHTATRNPTKYDFLNAGMMKSEDETRVLESLRRHPPERILYLRLDRAEFLRTQPNAGNLLERFPRIDEWVEQHYQPGDLYVAGYRLWHRKAQQESSARPPGARPDKL